MATIAALIQAPHALGSSSVHLLSSSNSSINLAHIVVLNDVQVEHCKGVRQCALIWCAAPATCGNSQFQHRERCLTNQQFANCRSKMSFFKKVKKHGRNRNIVIEDEDEQEDDSIMEIQANINKLKQKDKDNKKKKKEKKKVEEKKAAPLLSFEDEQEDEEEESFKVKKSSASRRLMKQKTKAEKEARFFAEPPPPPPYSPPPSLSANGANNGRKKHMEEYKSEDNDVAIVIKVSSANQLNSSSGNLPLHRCWNGKS